MGCSYPSSTSGYAKTAAPESESSSSYQLLEAPAALGTTESRKHPTGASGWLHVWKGLWKFTSATRPVETRAQPFSIMKNIAAILLILAMFVPVTYATSSQDCKDMGHLDTCNILNLVNPTKCSGGQPYECKPVKWGWTGLPSLYCWVKTDTCSSNEECKDPLGTTGAHCVTKSGCLYSNPSCGSDYNCVSNTCVKKSGCLYSNPSCGSDYNCVNNACVKKSGCAYSNPSCGSDYNCVSNTCVKKSGCAYSNPSCGSDYNCVSNTCVKKSGCLYSNPSCGSDYNCVSNTCVKKSGCLYSNPSCGSGYDCISNQCVQKVCQINTVYWSTSSTTEGNSVIMTIETSNCDGKSVSFDIYEDDTWPLADDYTATKTATVSSGKATATWTTVWVSDCILDACGDPEFYFTATVDGKSKSTSDMSVAKKPCVNDCSSGQKQCSGTTGYQTCQQDSNGCWKWSAVTSCSSSQDCSGGSCVTKSGCQYNNPACASNQNCVSNSCVTKLNCQITNAYWSASSIYEGKSATMTLETNSDCNGKSVTFDIYEDDTWPLADDYVPYVTTAPYVVSNGKVTATWTAIWMSDVCGLDVLCGNPEYYFTGKVDGKTRDSSDMEVYKCGNDCTSGQTICDGSDGYKICTQDGNGCWKWSSKNTCSAGYTCNNGGCVYVTNCQISKVYWSKTSANESDTVTMTLETNSDCNSKQVAFNIYEDDTWPLADDKTGPTIYSSVSNGKATASWVALWQSDCIADACGNPEYYFTANVDGKSKDSSDMEVYKKGCSCTAEYSPVCGADNQTYSNRCLADCKGVAIAYQGECKSTAACIINNAYWSVNNGWIAITAKDNDVVSLTAKTNGNCLGKNMTFKVKESDDSSADDNIASITAISSNDTAKAIWNAKWITDCILDLCGDPEYYFEVYVDGIRMYTSPLMWVSKDEMAEIFDAQNNVLIVDNNTNAAIYSAGVFGSLTVTEKTLNKIIIRYPSPNLLQLGEKFVEIRVDPPHTNWNYWEALSQWAKGETKMPSFISRYLPHINVEGKAAKYLTLGLKKNIHIPIFAPAKLVNTFPKLFVYGGAGVGIALDLLLYPETTDPYDMGYGKIHVTNTAGDSFDAFMVCGEVSGIYQCKITIPNEGYCYCTPTNTAQVWNQTLTLDDCSLTKCEMAETPEVNCQVYSLAWLKSSANEGDNVGMQINTVNCIGETLELSILEDDSVAGYGIWPFGSESMLKKDITITNDSQKEHWRVYYTEDQRTNPEYYFVLNASKDMKSGLLNVYPTESTKKLADAGIVFSNSAVTIIMPLSASVGMGNAISDLRKALESKGNTVTVLAATNIDCNDSDRFEGKNLVIVGTKTSNMAMKCIDLNSTSSNNSISMTRNRWSSGYPVAALIMADNSNYDSVIAFANIIRFGSDPSFKTTDYLAGCLWDGNMNGSTAGEVACNVVPYVELAPDVRDSLNCLKIVNVSDNTGALVCTVTFVAAGIDVGGLFLGGGLIEGTIGDVIDIPLSELKVALKNADVSGEVAGAANVIIKQNPKILVTGIKAFKKAGLDVAKDSDLLVKIIARGPDNADKVFKFLADDDVAREMARYTGDPSTIRGIKRAVADGTSWFYKGGKVPFDISSVPKVDRLFVMRMFKEGKLTQSLENSIKELDLAGSSVNKVVFREYLDEGRAIGAFTVTKETGTGKVLSKQVEIAYSDTVEGLYHLSRNEFEEMIVKNTIPHEVAHAKIFERFGDIKYNDFEEYLVGTINRKASWAGDFAVQEQKLIDVTKSDLKNLVGDKALLAADKEAYISRLAGIKAEAIDFNKKGVADEVDVLLRSTFTDEKVAKEYIDQTTKLSTKFRSAAEEIATDKTMTIARKDSILFDLRNSARNAVFSVNNMEIYVLAAATGGIVTIATVDAAVGNQSKSIVDLAVMISSVTETSQLTSQGRMVQVSFNVMNKGKDTQTAKWKITVDGTGVEKTGAIGIIGGANIQNKVSMEVPMQSTNIRAVVDYGNEIAEYDEGNNYATYSMTASTSNQGNGSTEPTGRKDVAVTYITASDLNKKDVERGLTENRVVSVKFSLSNLGEKAVDIVGWKVFVSGTNVEIAGTSNLNLGETRQFEIQITCTKLAQRINVVADYDNKLEETDENNNKRIIDIAPIFTN